MTLRWMHNAFRGQTVGSLGFAGSPRRAGLIFGVAAMAAMSFVPMGCSVVNSYDDPLAVGDWRLEINSDSRMTLELEGGGDTRIQIEPPGSEVRYSISWEQRATDEFKLTLKCKSAPNGCDGLNFIMDCESSTSGNDLDCTPRSVFSGVFNWNRDD